MTSLKLVSPYRPAHRSRFKSSKKKLKIPKKWIFVAVITAVFVGGVFYLFFSSTIFKVKRITISGNKQLTTDQLNPVINEYLTSGLKKLSGRIGIAQNNLFVLSADKLEASLRQQYNQIDTIRITKKYPDQITVKLSERNPVILYCQFMVIGDNPRSVRGCYLVDEKGIVYRDAPFIEGSTMPIVEDWVNQKVDLGQAVSDEKTASFILDVAKGMPMILGIKPAYFLVQSNFNLVVTTQPGWQIYLDLQKDASPQLHVLKRLIDQEIKDKISTLKYIDLRVDGRIYYK